MAARRNVALDGAGMSRDAIAFIAWWAPLIVWSCVLSYGDKRAEAARDAERSKHAR
jgi:hypothetical protein